ncbi:MAG: hypothetical protein QOH88_849 [Verrucomicrobiota bacterium]|jgi:ubiquinone/menaquinone biosynthesis C-methylase UbiE/uncharacterized protein YbaR (Trm112 family)
MNLSNYKCLVCDQSRFRTYTTYWHCDQCGQNYPVVAGMPKLLLEENIGQRDRVLRDIFYNGFLGRFYQYVMPFLALPARLGYWRGWVAYGAIVAAMLALAGHVAYFFLAHRWHPISLLDATALILFAGILLFLLKHKYLLYLFLVAVPVKISLTLARFKAEESFLEVHKKLVDELLQRKETLQVLDISTGTCNSLYRHGWMKLKAEFTGLDLSETMLRQGLQFMASQKVLVDLVLGSATQLPFESERFDVVLNYGALNGYTEPRQALEEMARVTKPGGLVLFLDEQLYPGASWIEKFYFQRVLSSHNAIHHCPVELMPPSLGDVKVHQIYQFYYLCTARKEGRA